MGNQEAKQKKAAAASGNGSYPSLDEGWREVGGEKKGGKKHGKHGGKGAGGSGGGVGVHGTGTAKKKNKSEPKSSVFSIRKRKGNLKGKGDAGSKEDILASQPDELDSTKTPEMSADELGQSDVETAFPDNKREPERGRKGTNGCEQDTQRKISTAATSPTEDGGQKGGSSGSDTDIYSFHSAADHEDLLADIQLAIRLQYQQHEGVNSIVDAKKGEERDLSWGGEGRKQSNGVVKLTPPEVLDITPELELGSDALSFLESGTLSESVKHMEQPAAPHIPFPTELHETREGQGNEEAGLPELNGKGQREREREASLCAAVGTKDQHAWLQQPSDTAITIATAGGAAAGPVTMATSGNSLPDMPFDGSSEAPGEKAESGSESLQEDREQPEVDSSPPAADSYEMYPEPTEVFISGSVFQEADGQFDPCTSAESLQDSQSTETESSLSAAASTSVSTPTQLCRRSSVSPLPPQESPTLAKRLLRSNHLSSSPGVKPYPPIFPSYIKTTTRQLSSPGQSPSLSPSHSPLSPRKAHQHLHRYLLRHVDDMKRYMRVSAQIRCSLQREKKFDSRYFNLIKAADKADSVAERRF